jgi:arabinan endo-1,5-alpha-L-arabinosidase
LTDGTYRIQAKVMPNPNEPVVLSAIGASTPALVKFDPKSDRSRWNFRTP